MVKISKFFAFGIIVVLASCHSWQGQTQQQVSDRPRLISSDLIMTGAERTDLYFPALKDKNIGLVCNHSSIVENTHLVDTLISAGFSVKVIFSPEHGFRGDSEAGAIIKDGKDGKTGVKIISLYGDKKKPSPADLEGLDVILFDIQDVGVRFYTYISTLTYMMEAAAELGIPLIVADRPNPNGFYIDGPLLDTNYRSFVGMHPVPVVYGMTIGEYALMVNGEGWLGNNKCKLTVIPLSGYDHNMIVTLKLKPSPNLPTWQSIYLYPSVCLFEGTFMSVGRGTGNPFQVIGHPDFMIGSFAFTPEIIPGVSENPLYKGQVCYGMNLTGFAENYAQNTHHFNLSWLIDMPDYYKDSTNFFNSYFNKLAGNDKLMNAILDGLSESAIRKSWEEDLLKFSETREKYLIYPDLAH